MSKASNIVELRTHEYSLDWVEDRKVKINLDEYVFFECDYRGQTWHLIGHKCDKELTLGRERNCQFIGASHWRLPSLYTRQTNTQEKKQRGGKA